MQRTEEKETSVIATRITESMQKAIEKILLTDGHLNTSDYIRDVIRKDLERRGLLETSNSQVFEKKKEAEKPCQTTSSE